MEGYKILEVKVVLTRIDMSKMEIDAINEDTSTETTEETSENGNCAFGHKRPRLAEPELDTAGSRSSGETEVDSEDGNNRQIKNVVLKRRRNHTKTPLTPLKRITKMKKMMALCNLKVNYKEFWENCFTSEQKIQRMFEYMKKNGLKGKPTFSKCRKLGESIRAKNQKNKDVLPTAVKDTENNDESDDDVVPDVRCEHIGNDEAISTDSFSTDTIESDDSDDRVGLQSTNVNSSPRDDGGIESNANIISETEREVQESPSTENRTEDNITSLNNHTDGRSADGETGILNGNGVNGTTLETGSVNAGITQSSNTTNPTNIVFGNAVSRNHLCIRRPIDGNVVPNTPVISRNVTEQVTVRCGRNLPSSQGSIMMNNTPNSISVVQFARNPVGLQNVIRGDMRPMVPNDHSICRVVGFTNAVPNSFVRIPDNVIRGMIPLGQPCMGPRIPVCYTNTRIPQMQRTNVGFPNGIRNCAPTPTLTYPYSGSNQGQQHNPIMVMNNHNDALGRINTLLNQVCSEGVMPEVDVDFLRNYRNEIRRRMARIEATNFLDKLIEYENGQIHPDDAISQKLKSILATLRRGQS